jgi:2-keto-4-pentenoate hydratase/2-oxohepta-3-ene-1,7-dioic acid hydratase in catechol pathway
MRLVTFSTEARRRLGVLEGDQVVELDPDRGWPSDMVELVARGREALAAADLTDAPRHSLGDVTLEAPLMPRKSVYAVGRNYLEHIHEVKEVRPVPEHPMVFTKPPTSVIGPGVAIDSSNDPTESVDYEGELAVVIGPGGKRISPEAAWGHVFGYTIVNDVSSRVLQKRHGQWVIGKGADTFCPMGPCLLTADEIDDVTAVWVRTKVNGEERQAAPVADLIFDIPTLIATLSRGITLEPGDVIATGTPAGVGLGFDPPVYLRPGDVVEVTVEPIGTLTNPVV